MYAELRRHVGKVSKKLPRRTQVASSKGIRCLTPRNHEFESTEVCDCEGGVYRGQVRDTSGPGERRIHLQRSRAARLGARALLIDRRSRRGRNPTARQEPGTGGRAVRSARCVEMSSHRCGGPKKAGPRQRSQPAAWSDSHINAPGSAAEYLPHDTHA